MAAMRTFSKAYGLAGLRVGYLMDAGARARHRSGAARVRRHRLAQAAALASLADADAQLPSASP